ncbi:MAG: SDR family oxidoreductase [Oscillatoriaceae bacterium SKW80]|nr:SDR family oxidoreductase [Oscillatoriaceae bacterium SKYG93]MCX8119393.1 SDR family oxidoreductase [Oscillatoriaceae bacterium SKW80]MDW8454860.1 SDR family oxidoreductase [Oscillatoriaceae cyanobacterium SKYGB_i_bin93]HIK28361.1 SDR family oxidoreductase [Oscillatoriaceae cyanobacterium M7585_C2015_266]
MKIAIVGCGYVGGAVARQWHQQAHEVTATTTTPKRVATLQEVATRVIVARGDDKVALQEAVQNQEIVLLSVGAKSSNLYEETYLTTAKNLVAAIKEAASVKQLIYTSSCTVYGDKNNQWVDEETPLAPMTKNGEILAETEQVLLQAASENLRVCILRLAGIYGPGRELTKIFQNVFGTVRPGSGDYFTNWIHLDDIVGALEFVRSRQLQGIYNLADDECLTGKELLDRLSDRYGLPKVMWDASLQSSRPYKARISNAKIKKAGYKLIHPQIQL